MTSDRPTPPSRAVIENVRPRVNDGQFPAKAVAGDPVEVRADVFVDGHDLLAVELRHRGGQSRSWRTEDMESVGNDRWIGWFAPEQVGDHRFQVRAFVDHFATWLHDLRIRIDAGQDVSGERLVGAQLAQRAADRVAGRAHTRLERLADDIRTGRVPDLANAEDAALARLVRRKVDADVSTTSPTYWVRAERTRARFSTWYELFPRSTAPVADRHGTLLDVIDRLDYVRDIGADVLYLPPIHPIGTTHRKGPNGVTQAEAHDPGSPWAIGSPQGGHHAIHPELGSVADLVRLGAAARERGIDLALDLAFQCSPDHPWVGEHPEWFKHRPDGSVQYAENPPKRYEDIYPLDFDSADWKALWEALHEVVEYWIGQGIGIFRVDNPHTKPFAFWEWLITRVHDEHPDVIFLAEAFTRPKVMKRLAKLGFTQSYTYFAWRTEKWELEQYLDELTRTEVADYFRPNFWPNTPDILTEQLQNGSRATFTMRALLAGTLAASYGIYGPSFELLERAPRQEGSEEYLDGEKFQLRHFDVDDPTSIAPFLAQLNEIRRRQLALQHNSTLTFHYCDNDQLLVYSKTVPSPNAAPSASWAAEGAEPVIVVVNLDDVHRQSGWVDLQLDALGPVPATPYTVHDLLSGASYQWEGRRNFVMLDPRQAPGHVFRVVPRAAGGVSDAGTAV